MNSFERLVDLKQFNVTEDELAAAGPYPIKWFNHEEDPALTILRIMRNPAHFHFTCKHLLGIDLNIFQLVVLNEMWNHPFPMLIATRGGSKTWMLALYSVLRAIFLPGTKVVATGMGFRQAKQILGYAFDFWKKSPVLQSLYADHPDSGPHPGNDRWVLRLGDSTITGLPIGDGSSIRGERANVVIGDEFASISREIFETVVAGFGVVSLSPTEQVRNKARIAVLKDLKAWNEELEERERNSGLGNQLIISGTAWFAFNHFHFYWNRWKQILESRGDDKKLREAFQGNEVPDGLDWRDYAIIRIPIELLPDGFMEMTQIARSKATMHSGIFQQEFQACFSKDSNGFFKRSLVESCITKDPVQPFNSTDLVKFEATLRGNPGCSYIYGIDPASEKDRLSIVILEVHPSHRRIVYCWTTTRQEFKQRLDDKLTGESDFYGFIAKKIRELMRFFPCDLIALDSQGGGIGVIEALGDLSKIKSDERPLYVITDSHPLHDGVDRESDDKPGLHIIEWVNFANSKYVSEANHGMRKDFEDKALLFPYCDPATLAIACEEDSIVGRKYDTQEDVVMEIEDLKDELSTITHTQTPTTLRDHWDTPDEKLPGQKKGRLRKDRYSSLLMANYAARRITRKEVAPPLMPHGGFIQHVEYNDNDDGTPDLGHGPDWWTKSVEGNFDDYGCV